MATDVSLYFEFENKNYYKEGGTYPSGAIIITGGGAGDTDFGNYYTKTIIDSSFYNISEIDASFYTKGQLDAGQLNNLYYTETEVDANTYSRTQLNAGQLNNLYYTETELNSGQLDTRYYTETELDAGQLDNRYYTETESDNLFVHLTGNETIAGVKTFSDTIKAENLNSVDVAYTSGFQGNGWAIIDTGGNNYKAEFDDLIIRGSMQIYELILNKFRATNGTLWVSDVVVATSSIQYDGVRYYFTVEEDTNTLMAGDKIRGQYFDGNNVRAYSYTVYSITSTRVTITDSAGSDDVKDMTFVRIGSSSNLNRQGSIFMTSSIENSPYLEVLDGMTTHTISDSNRKLRLGSLSGLTFDGDSIGGYGLYSDNVYLQGKIYADAGYIADWNIVGDSLHSETTSGELALDGGDLSMTITDSTGDVKVRIGAGSIPSIITAYLGSDKDFTGSYADAYTDVSQVSATGSGDDSTWYLQEYSTNTYLDMFTSNQGVTRHIPVTVSNPYWVTLKWDTTLSYSVPSNDTDETDGETVEYWLAGTYDQIITVKAYSSAGTLLETQVNTFNNLQDNITDTIIFQKYVTSTDSYIYFTIQVDTDNDLRVDKLVHIWENDGGWVERYSYQDSQSLTTTFNMQVEELLMKGTVDQVAIGNNGFMHWVDTDKWFMVNKDQTDYINTCGEWYHRGELKIGDTFNSNSDWWGATNIRYPYSGTSSNSFTSYAVNINANHSNGYALAIENAGNDSNRRGMLIRYGMDYPTSVDNIAIRFEDGNGTYEGAIYSDDSQLTLYYASDKKLKAEIKNKEIDALRILGGIQLKTWKWRKRDKSNNIIDGTYDPIATGYIADEVELIYPEAVKIDPDTGLKSMADTRFIPLLHTAINQQQKTIESLTERLDEQEEFMNDMRYEMEQMREDINKIKQ